MKLKPFMYSIDFAKIHGWIFIYKITDKDNYCKRLLWWWCHDIAHIEKIIDRWSFEAMKFRNWNKLFWHSLFGKICLEHCRNLWGITLSLYLCFLPEKPPFFWCCSPFNRNIYLVNSCGKKLNFFLKLLSELLKIFRLSLQSAISCCCKNVYYCSVLRSDLVINVGE